MQLRQKDNIEAKLNGKHKIKITYNNNSFLLEILNNIKPILQFNLKKDILQNQSIKNNLITFIVDTKIIENRKEAREYINNIYAKLTPKLLDLKKRINEAKKNANKIAGIDEEEKFVFNTDNIKKRLHSGLGIFETKLQGENNKPQYVNRYYFGFNIEKRIPKYSESGDFLFYLQHPKLCLVFDDNSMEEAEKLEADNNIKFSGDLIQDGYRWRLEAMKDYLDHQGQPKNNKVPTLKEHFENIKKKYKEYFYFHESGFYDLFPIWDIGTYFFILFNAYPYISLEGFAGSGKTKVMDCSQLISFNGLKFVNISPASLFRIVDQNKSTLYVDEAENLYSKAGMRGEDDASEIVSLLNAGWQKGSKVPRQEKGEDGKWRSVFFDVYSPKMISSINGVKGALETRAIKCVMLKAKRDDPRGDLWPEATDNDFLKIRNDMYSIAFEYWKQIEIKYTKGSFDELKKEFKISNRDWQIWKPLLCIAKLIDEEIYQRLGKFAEELYEEMSMEKIDEESWDYKVLESLTEVVTIQEEWVPVKQIKGRLSTKFNENDKRPSSHWIGRYLRRIGLNKKRRLKTGMEYFLSKKIVNNILNRLDIITLSSQTTQTTPVEEEQITEEIDNTYHRCSNCGRTDIPCTYFNKKTNKLICKECNKVENE